MSHLKQREEKYCLNCNAVTHGRYCSLCGQENLEPQETVGHLVTHTFNDITHFDGKFFSSIKYILTKPGFLSSEYMRGRRKAYLDPIRFYLFTSFLFFLIIFSFFSKDEIIKTYESNRNLSAKDSLEMAKGLKLDGVNGIKLDSIIQTTEGNDNESITGKKSVKSKANFLNIGNYRDREEFDSLDKLGKVDRNFLTRKLINKGFEIEEKYGSDGKRSKEALKENFFHYAPQMLFLSLPFFALLLKILYFRRKKYYYVAHIIFTIHFYIFVYMQILLINIFGAIADITKIGFIFDFTIVLGLAIIYYAYRAMRVFYEQSKRKTILKLLILTFALIFLFTFFLILLFGFSLYKM